MIKTFIKKLFNKSGYSITSIKYVLKQFIKGTDLIQLDFDHVVSKYLTLEKKNQEPFTFIQIGAFDGVECDPLYKYLQRYKWNGILLEPQPEPFNKLKSIYYDRPQIIVLNAAVSDTNGKTTLFVLEGNELPSWSKGMASFDRHNILKHEYLFPKISEYIREIEIDTITFDKLFSEQSIKDLDLLQIDTEGYDADILNMFPFDYVKPRLIHFESKHIPKQKLERLLDRLIGYGYKIARDREEDMMAILDDIKEQS